MSSSVLTSPRRRPPWYLLTAGAITVGAMALPVGYLLIQALFHSDDVENLAGPFMRARIGRTLALTVCVTTLAATLSLLLAWLTVRTSILASRLLALLLVAPLAVPPYVTAYALLSVGGDNGLLVRLLGSDSPLLRWLFTNADTGVFHVPRLTGFAGALLALTAYNLPYIYLPVRAALIGTDASLEEASRCLGRSRLYTLIRITGPQILPALLAGSLLVALHVVADFGVVSLMRYDTLSASLYARYNAFDLGNASRMGMLLVILAGVLVLAEWLMIRRLRVDRLGIGVAREARLLPLGWWQAPAIALCLLVFIIGAAAPAAISCYWMSLLTDWSSISANLFKALKGSVMASLPAAVVTTALAIPVAVLSERYPGRLSAFIQRMPMLGYAVPALAFGLSLITFFTAQWIPESIFRLFYQSLPLLVLAYVFHFLAEAVGPVRSSLKLTSPRLEEAARSLGSTQAGALIHVTLPIIRHGLIVAMALVFLSCMKELPLTMLLAPLGSQSLARNAWDHTENAEFTLAAPYAMAILICSATFVGLLLMEKRKRT